MYNVKCIIKRKKTNYYELCITNYKLFSTFAAAKELDYYLLNKKRTMAYVISDDCVMCGTCAGECPSEAISEGDGKYVIDPNACVDCGTCADACPTGAINPGE